MSPLFQLQFHLHFDSIAMSHVIAFVIQMDTK